MNALEFVLVLILSGKITVLTKATETLTFEQCLEAEAEAEKTERHRFKEPGDRVSCEMIDQD